MLNVKSSNDSAKNKLLPEMEENGIEYLDE